jgi:hypothetical protein
MRAAVLFTWVMAVGCHAGEAAAPSSTATSRARVTLSIEAGLLFAGGAITVAAHVFDADGRTIPNADVRWSATPDSAVVASLMPATCACAVLQLLRPGRVSITATAAGATGTASIEVAPVPPPTTALTVERFVLYRYEETAGSPVGYMPQVTLRETTGRNSAELIGVYASVPNAPALRFCTTSRVWTPGMTADAFGLSYGEPDFWFGPIAPQDFPLGPVELVLIVRTHDGALGSVQLSRTMTPGDVISGPLAASWTANIACR